MTTSIDADRGDYDATSQVTFRGETHEDKLVRIEGNYCLVSTRIIDWMPQDKEKEQFHRRLTQAVKGRPVP
jgi:hypothetical protein